MIGQVNNAITSHNLTYIDQRITEARGKLDQANNIVCHPSCYNAICQADQVRKLAIAAGDTVRLIERDRHLFPLLVKRNAQIDRLKKDIDAMSRTPLIVAAIKERQDEVQKQEQAHLQQLQAEARRREEEHRQAVKDQADKLKPWLERFESAISCSALDQARQALSIIEQRDVEVLSVLFTVVDYAWALTYMRQRVESLRREVYGRHGIRNLDAPHQPLLLPDTT